MLRRATAIVMLSAFAAHLAGCYKNSTVSISPNAARSGRDSRFIGVTTRNAEYVRFDEPAVINAGRIAARVHGTPYETDVDSVQYFWVERRQLDGTKTVLAVIGIGVAAGVIAGAATGSNEPEPPPPEVESCPFIYSWNGTAWVLDAEPYGGSISRGLERDDHVELEHLRPDDGRYHLMVRNELDETQHTNLTELWVADHSPNVSIAADAFGGLYTLRNPEPPLAASDEQGRDLLPWLSADDKLIWEPAPVAGDDSSLRQEVVLTFAKPEAATRVKLVARASTALWGSHMILQMLKLRGATLPQWYAAVDNGLPEATALYVWNLREELYTLQVAVEEPSGWVVRGLLPGGGPFIVENRVVVLDVSQVPGDRVRIRLRPPAGFWALNSFALDATPDEQVHVTKLLPSTAQDALGNDLRSALSQSDDSYHVMPTIGDVAYLDFAVPAPVSGTRRTVFLHTRGWYRVHLEASGEPNLAGLGQVFDVPGGATQLSAERYAAWLATRRTREGSGQW